MLQHGCGQQGELQAGVRRTQAHVDGESARAIVQASFSASALSSSICSCLFGMSASNCSYLLPVELRHRSDAAQIQEPNSEAGYARLQTGDRVKKGVTTGSFFLCLLLMGTRVINPVPFKYMLAGASSSAARTCSDFAAFIVPMACLHTLM